MVFMFGEVVFIYIRNWVWVQNSKDFKILIVFLKNKKIVREIKPLFNILKRWEKHLLDKNFKSYLNEMEMQGRKVKLKNPDESTKSIQTMILVTSSEQIMDLHKEKMINVLMVRNP